MFGLHTLKKTLCVGQHHGDLLLSNDQGYQWLPQAYMMQLPATLMAADGTSMQQLLACKAFCTGLQGTQLCTTVALYKLATCY